MATAKAPPEPFAGAACQANCASPGDPTPTARQRQAATRDELGVSERSCAIPTNAVGGAAGAGSAAVLAGGAGAIALAVPGGGSGSSHLRSSSSAFAFTCALACT